LTLPQPAVALLNDPKAYATVITMNRDGSPHVTLVWIEAVDGVPSFNTAVGRVKDRNLKRDPRVIVSVVNSAGNGDYAVFYGQARVTEDGAIEQIDRLAKKYTGRDRYNHQPGETRIRVDIDVDRIGGRGPWVTATPA
jgi:PPOX class probable F420-dependent enzyme